MSPERIIKSPKTTSICRFPTVLQGFRAKGLVIDFKVAGPSSRLVPKYSVDSGLQHSDPCVLRHRGKNEKA